MIDLTPHALAARARAHEHKAAAVALQREARRLNRQAHQYMANCWRELAAADRLLGRSWPEAEQLGEV
jgi:hypothetical protein